MSEQEILQEAWWRLRQFYEGIDILNDGPDDSDEEMAYRILKMAYSGCRDFLVKFSALIDSPAPESKDE